ncbi:MAG TPA: hypothetical protein V6D46_00195, partial [Coleofasciculaceae cyanobacterium]
VLNQVVNTLEIHQVHYQITGGLAGNFYGSTWPVQDLDFDVLEVDLARVYHSFEPWAIAPPDRRIERDREALQLQLQIDGVAVDITAAEAAYALRGQKRLALKTDLTTAHRARCYGRSMWVQSLQGLIARKTLLQRSADLADLRQLR